VRNRTTSDWQTILHDRKSEPDKHLPIPGRTARERVIVMLERKRAGELYAERHARALALIEPKPGE
jgi:hypothetical protein